MNIIRTILALAVLAVLLSAKNSVAEDCRCSVVIDRTLGESGSCSPANGLECQSCQRPGSTRVVEATIVALRKENGEVAWKCRIPERDIAAYAAMVVSNAGGIHQYVTFLEKGVVGVSAENGNV